MTDTSSHKTIYWSGDIAGYIDLIDQTLLPNRFERIACRDVETLREAIVSLRVRGAPAIGVAAAMGVILGIRDADSEPSLFDSLEKVCDRLASSRPTAVNLFWALDRMRAKAETLRGQPLDQIKAVLLAEACVSPLDSSLSGFQWHPAMKSV